MLVLRTDPGPQLEWPVLSITSLSLQPHMVVDMLVVVFCVFVESSVKNTGFSSSNLDELVSTSCYLTPLVF